MAATTKKVAAKKPAGAKAPAKKPAAAKAKSPAAAKAKSPAAAKAKAAPATKPAATKPAAAKSAPAKRPATSAAAKTEKAPSVAFSSIVATLGQNPGINTRKMFGAHGLNLGGRAFAMEYKGSLVVKLPAARVDALVAGGTGSYFEPGMGRMMKEWLSVAPGRGDWSRLAEEALAFAATLPPK